MSGEDVTKEDVSLEFLQADCQRLNQFLFRVQEQILNTGKEDMRSDTCVCKPQQYPLIIKLLHNLFKSTILYPHSHISLHILSWQLADRRRDPN